MLGRVVFFVLFVAVQVIAQIKQPEWNYFNPDISYYQYYPFMRNPRRAQAAEPQWTSNPVYGNPSQPYDIQPKQSVYDVNPPRRSQPAYDVNPPMKSQPAYDDNPPMRSQPAYDVNPPRRSQPAYDVNPPMKSQPAYDVNPPRRSQPAYDVNPPSRSQPAYDVNPPRRSQPAYDVNPPMKTQPAYDVNPPMKSQPDYDVNPATPLKAYDVDPPVASKQAYDVDPPGNTTSNENPSKAYDVLPPGGVKMNQPAYWVEPYSVTATAADVGPSGPNQRNNGPGELPRLPDADKDDEPKCILPPLPDHGSYVKNDPNPTTLRFGSELVTLNVTCDPGYSLRGAVTVHCYNGFWADEMPKCLPVICHLKKHHSVEYRCLVVGDVVGSRVCSEEEPVGTIVSPRCHKPHYYSTSNNLALMHCGADGNWDHVAKCTPECGTVTSNGRGLVVGGQPAKRGELPWHVGVYMKRFMPYKQVCGGSLISNNLIISAAHCFWDDVEQKLPAADFAVAVGKLYRPWDDKMDDAQKSDVKEIHIPPRFQGAASNFQDDIAMVIPATAFEFKNYVRPICLSFDSHFDRLQLQTVNVGKVAGWGLTSADDESGSSVLQVVELPYVEVGTCILRSPPSFTAHITSDKICAGTTNTTTALCRGDSGGGLTFEATDRDTARHYLRGVVSTAPSDTHACNTATYTSFTHVQRHEDFIKQFITEA